MIYDVLEAHQGDKFYKPGDPETGQRIADPNAVDHLVKRGMLREAADQSALITHDENFAAPAPADNNLTAQIDALTQERDAAQSDLAKAREDLHAMTAERDALRDARSEQDGAGEGGEQPPVPSQAPNRRHRQGAN